MTNCLQKQITELGFNAPKFTSIAGEQLLTTHKYIDLENFSAKINLYISFKNNITYISVMLNNIFADSLNNPRETFEYEDEDASNIDLIVKSIKRGESRCMKRLLSNLTRLQDKVYNIVNY